MPAALPTPEQFSANLHRVMAQLGVTMHEVVERTGVDERTVRAVLAGTRKPQPRTLHNLASGLGIDAVEFFQNPALLANRSFDRATNPAVADVIESHPHLFSDWTTADFDELYSRMGAGGQLTPAGALAAVEQMNRKHELLRKVALVLETNDAELLADMIELLYKRVTLE